MGLALYFPAIKALGLVDAARQSFSLPRSVIFGVRAVTLSQLVVGRGILGGDTIGEAAEVADEGLCRIGSETELRLACLRHTGLKL
jgi:hypothetical protein